MKTTSKYFILLATCLMLSCESLVDGDININPNNFASTDYKNVLITSEVAQILLQSGETTRRAGIFAGAYTGIERQQLGYNNYELITSDFDDLWSEAFVNCYRNAALTEELAIEQGVTEGIGIGIAQVLQAMSIGTSTSLYGDVPFDELADPAFTDPRFEDQVDVYAKIQLLLDDAIANLNLGTNRPPSGSDFYVDMSGNTIDGDPATWLQAAYTLKARYYMHTKEYANAYLAAQNGINSADNSIYAPHSDATTGSNLNWGLFASGNVDLIVSNFMVRMVSPDSVTTYRGNAKTNETARFDFLFEYVGTLGGFVPNRANDKFGGQTTSSALVTYQENLLILAEAGLRSDGFSTGLGHLNTFRTFMSTGGYLLNPAAADLQYDIYLSTDFDNGGIENPDNISADDALLREILEERYITLFGQVEIFNDTRRTEGESVVRAPVLPNVGSELPQRFLYPQTEIDRNVNIPDPLPSLFEKTEVNQ